MEIAPEISVDKKDVPDNKYDIKYFEECSLLEGVYILKKKIEEMYAELDELCRGLKK